MSQGTEPYRSPESMAYHLEGNIDNGDDLLSFSREFGFDTSHSLSSYFNSCEDIQLPTAQNSSHILDRQDYEFLPTQIPLEISGQRNENLDMSHADQSQAQQPASNAGQLARQLIATPRRKFQSADDRQKTAETRKLTACVRCRMQRIRARSLLSCFLVKLVITDTYYYSATRIHLILKALV